MKTLMMAILWGAVSAAWAAGPMQPFSADTLERIRAQRAGQPFILALWSLDCAYCKPGLAALGRFARRHPEVRIISVSTDDAVAQKQLQGVLHAAGLDAVPAWFFGDEPPEKLRFVIDPRWHGELPRTYLYDRRHRATAISGAVSERTLEAWRAGLQ